MSIVEVLVVMVIIVIITSLSLPNMHQARIESNRITTLHNMAMLAEANGMYFHKHRMYAPALEDLYHMKLLEDQRFLQARSNMGSHLDGYFYYYNCQDSISGFLQFATPAEHGKSGLMSYCTGEMAIIFERNLGIRSHDELRMEFEVTDYRIPPMGKTMEIFPSGRSMILGNKTDDVWAKSNLVVE